ncbi:MAG: helix-turn-helix domain-containing protein [Lachnospiraceae bacterium]|nr:helix-turn-helix domain-containing protein [Lachnospiraceae bacterium]
MNELVYLKNMRKLRSQSHFTQQEVSERLHIRRSTYCNYENGMRMPPLSIIAALAELYHVSVDYLIHSTEETDVPANYRHLHTSERLFLDHISELTQASKKEVWQFIYLKKQYPS